MLTYNGINIELEKADEKLTSYMDSFFDFYSLISYVELTYKGKQKYSDNFKGIIEAILMTTKNNKDYKKFDRFRLKSEEWDLYFNEHFAGFDNKDVNKSIAEITARELEKRKINGTV
jgi:hypothetical protein